MLAFAARTVVSLAGKPAWRALDVAGGSGVEPDTRLRRNGVTSRRGDGGRRPPTVLPSQQLLGWDRQGA